jgi:hypothetical protein
MPRLRRNEPDAANRRLRVFLFTDDGQTPAPITTNYDVKAATLSLAFTSGVLVGVIAAYDPGSTGNKVTLRFVADGAGVGNVTGVGFAFVFHFQSGVTTIANATAQLSGVGITFTGAFTPSNVLTTPNDVFGPSFFSDGEDSAVWISPGDTTEAESQGTTTNINSRPGYFLYQFTQGETDFNANQGGFRVTKKPRLDISALTTHCATIVEAKVPVDGTGGWSLAFVHDAGAAAGGALTNVGTAYTYTYKGGTTTVANFEDAIAASADLEVLHHGTRTTVLVAVVDEFGATVFAGYHELFENFDMDNADFNAIAKGSRTYGDMLRGIEGALVGVANGFGTPTLEWWSPEGDKLLWTITRNSTGRLTATEGDLTP